MDTTLAVICALAVGAVVAAAVLALLEHRRRVETFAQHPTKLYVRPLWGVANRFRTLNVAHDLARLLRIPLVILENDDKFWHSKLDTLCHFDGVDVVQTDGFYATTPKETYEELIFNVEGDCSRWTTVKEVRDIVATGKSVVIYACGLDVRRAAGEPDLVVTDDFYKKMRVTPAVLAKLAGVIDTIRAEPVVGVHVRQGSITDFHNGWFFMDWHKGPDDKVPVFCCSQEPGKSLSSCTTNVAPIEKFVAAMKRFPATQKFFVASDRPGCYLNLEAEFPGRILHNRIAVEHDVDSDNAFLDWYCLSQCSKLVLSGISSYSGEAMKVRGTSAEFL